MTARFPNTVSHNGSTYWLSDLATSDSQLETTLAKLETNNHDHHIIEHTEIDLTDWPGQPNHVTTVYAIYINTMHTASRHREVSPSHGSLR